MSKNIIKINDDFSILQYKYGWELHHWTDGLDKNKNPKRQNRITFHPHIKAMSNELLNRTAGECDSLVGIVNLLENASTVVAECMEIKLKDLL